MKRFVSVLVSLLMLIMCMVSGCSPSQKEESVKAQAGDVKVPKIKVSYIFTNHQTPLMVAAKKGEFFKDKGVYLKEIADRQKYTLMKDEKAVADVELVVCKSGSETMTMMSQGHIDIGLASSAANITAMDKGTNIKMLCPVHTEGIALVAGKDSDVSSWDEFVQKAKESDKPLKVGYHSPTSAPVILFEAAMKEGGIPYTFNPEDTSADILLVDLKGTSNLIPALVSSQVDAWVGPSPYPDLAVTENSGKIILDMKNLPPEGKWYDFPCCVASATEKMIQEKPEVVQAFTDLIAVAAQYSDENKGDAAKITSEFTGVSEEAARMSSIKYTADPSDTWVSNLGLVYDTLKKADKLKGSYVDKEYDEVKEEIFDFSFIQKSLEK